MRKLLFNITDVSNMFSSKKLMTFKECTLARTLRRHPNPDIDEVQKSIVLTCALEEWILNLKDIEFYIQVTDSEAFLST
jgi:hypothetical protein